MFRVTITETKTIDTITAKSWEQGAAPEGGDAWGWTPQVPTKEKVEVNLLTQVVASLDISAVIRAVNGLE